ncbi:MAG: hypothetical protein JSV96_04040 [Candidatus Aminicenantes bacterium]|nr:MAG: hypothetical protein JSV96_04040 [Candidatus Aminicenantes bacterium]
MNMILFEDKIKYDLWVKISLVFSIVLLLALALLFYVDGYKQDLIKSEPAKESKVAAIVLFASIAFVLLVYWAVLPRDLYILQDKIKIKHGIYSLNFRLENIESASAASGLPLGNYISSITSFKNQIEIVRKKGLKLRISPCRRDLFLENLNRALMEWRRTNPG